MNKLPLLVSLLPLALAGAALIILTSDADQRFQLVENIEPQPLPLVNPSSSQSEVVAPNTLQARPATIRANSAPGAELAPLTITNSFPTAIRLAASVQGSPAIQLSTRSWTQPSRSTQQIGVRLIDNLPPAASGKIVILATLPADLALRGRSGKRQIIFRRDLQLQIPFTINAANSQTESPPAPQLDSPRLSKISTQFQPQVAVENVSDQPAAANGGFQLRGPRDYEQRLAPGQTLLPGLPTTLLAQEPWEKITPGRYQLQADLAIGPQRQSASSSVYINRSGQIKTLRQAPAALALAVDGDRLQITVSNNSSARGLAPTTVFLRPASQAPAKLPIPALAAKKRYTIYQPLPPSGRLKAEIRQSGKSPLASTTLIIPPPSRPAAINVVQLMAAVVFGAILLLAWTIFWRRTAPPTKSAASADRG